MERKGFPESYDGSGAAPLPLAGEGRQAPCRGAGLFAPRLRRRARRDGQRRPARHPDRRGPERAAAEPACRATARPMPFVSDFFDFSIYLDADEDLLEKWYVERFMRLRETAFRDPALLLPANTPRLSDDGGRGDGARHLEPHQPAEPARKHPADPPARQPDPDQGREPPHRAGRAAQAVTAASVARPTAGTCFSVNHVRHEPGAPAGASEQGARSARRGPSG